MKSVFKNKNYLLLLSAQTVSNFGDWLHILALLSLVAIKWDGSPLQMSGLMLCLMLPSILLGSAAGVLADKSNRRGLMIVADLCRAGLVVGIAFASTIWLVYIYLFLCGVFSTIFNPAKSGTLREIVSDEEIQPAIAYSEMVNNGAKIIGPTLSGVLISVLSVQTVILLDALTFAISAMILLFLKGSMKNTHPIERVMNNRSAKSFWVDLVDGLKLIKKSPFIFYGLFILATMFLALQIADSQAIILIRVVGDNAVRITGYSMAASGLGMFIASTILSRRPIKSGLVSLISSIFILGACLIAPALTVHLSPIILLFLFPVFFFFVGLSFALGIIPFNVLVQKNTPKQFTGRVFGTINSVTTMAAVIGISLGGLLSTWLGVVPTFIISGMVLIIIAFIAYLLKNNLESRETIDAESIRETF